MTTFATNPTTATQHAGLPHGSPPDPNILAANLSALSRRNPRLAEAVLAASPAPGVRFVMTDDGVLSADLDGRALASRRRPIEEAQRLADTLEPLNAGCAVVLGFGVGHHVRLLSEKLDTVGVVACFEPDVGLLRAVFEHIDHSAWLAAGTTAIFHDPDDRPAVTFGVQGWEAPLAVGVQIIEHAPSRPRLGDLGGRFAQTFSSVVGTVRTHVITTMVHADITARNALMNIAHYAGMPGIGELQGAALGRPAIVVSAGPSLKRTIHHLKDPAVRERCVIVAVQTVLKQLLAEGIRPHFVCALDYHEVSRRFYEGLTADDVRGVTLVAEPKANAAILDAFPGEKRLVADEFLEELFAFDETGSGFGGTHAPMKPGATVAHLAYYLARFLGSDPVILTGQDLAFTDGQYYSAGAAIHDTWACELNAFNTLEMMEWQRIIRMRGNLHAVTDHLGRPVYSDDQMVAYLHQFERDFMEDDSRGLTVIDATEGGVRKSHTVTMPMGEAVEMYVRHARPLPGFAPAMVNTNASGPRINAIKERLKKVRADVRTIARLSRETRDLLVKLAGRLNDAERANATVRQIHALRDRVESLRPAYALVHRINQAGTFKRFKADRAIRLEGTLTPDEEQRKRCERDSMNVGWIADSADALDDLLGASVAALEGAPKRTRDIALKPDADDTQSKSTEAPKRVSTGAVIVLDCAEARSVGLIRRTLERLAASKALRNVVIATDDEARARAGVGGPILGLDVHFFSAPMDAWRERRAAVRSARAWAGTCWRGGIAGLTVFDEVYDPQLTLRAMEREGLDAALLVGADWCAVDPDLTRAVVERFAEVRESQPLTFTQAPPGLCGCVISRELAGELAKGVESFSALASIGGVLGYRPLNARADLIAHVGCVTIPASVRSTLARFVADERSGGAVEELGTGAEGVCAAARASMVNSAGRGPSEVVVSIAGASGWIDAGGVARVIGSLGAVDAVPAVTLVGMGRHDALGHPGLRTIVEAVKGCKGAKPGGCGLAPLHVRTSLDLETTALMAMTPLLVEHVDVVSIDCVAGTAETHAVLCGSGGFERVLNNIDALLSARRVRGGLLTPWIVPRITRRDAVYSEIEGFFDKSMLVAGWGVIDPLPAPIPGERIEPLPLPAAAKVRELLSVLEIGAGSMERCVSPDAVRALWAQTLNERVAVIEADPRLRAVLQPGA